MQSKGMIFLVLGVILSIVSLTIPWITYLNISNSILTFTLNFEEIHRSVFNFTEKEVYLIIITVAFTITGILVGLASIKVKPWGYFAGAFLITSGITWNIFMETLRTRLGLGNIFVYNGYGNYIILLAGILTIIGEIIRKGE